MELGIEFEEQLAGYFSLNALNPEAGEQKGKSSNQHLVVHTRVTIEDLHRWLETRSCSGNLNGTVDFPPLGKHLPIQSGHIGLSNTNDLLDIDLLIYEMNFRARGQDYFLTGKKQVSHDHCPDSWPDVMTVYAQLHEGNDRDAPITGAGILKLELDDLFDMLSTITVMGTDSVPEKAIAIRQFGKLYLGELWKTCSSFVGSGEVCGTSD